MDNNGQQIGWSGGGGGSDPSETSWLLNGNTVGSEKYFGTNDDFSVPIYTNGVKRATIYSTGQFGIGTDSTPASNFEVASNDVQSIIISTRYQSSVGGSSGVLGRKARGTQTTPTALLSGDSISSFGAQGYSGSVFNAISGRMTFVCAENFTVGASGTNWSLNLAPVGSLTTQEVISVLSSGYTGIGSTSPDAKLSVVGSSSVLIDYTATFKDDSLDDLFTIRCDGQVNSRDGYSIGGNLFVSNATSVTNTFIGVLSGQTSSAGSERSVAVGYGALQNIGANPASTAVGYLSLNASTNTRNTAVGVNSALALSSGNAVTAIGDGALSQMTTEGEATAVGFLAGFGVTAGNGCVFIGSRAGYAGDQVAGVNNSIAIGYGATTISNNQLVIGNQGAGSQILDFAIGYGAQVSTGFVADTTTTIRPTDIASGVSNQSNGYHICIAGGIGTGTGIGSDIKFKVSPAGSTGSTQNALVEIMRISSSQNVGIGTTAPSAQALLELVSTSKALLIMRMTADQASAITPANGMGLYVTDTNLTFLTTGFWKYENGAWVVW